jgi:DNA-binding MarR family transcriptional regulator
MGRRGFEILTEIVLEVFRLNGDLVALGDALTADIGLTSARWQVMGAVALASAPLTIAQAARNMGLTRQSVRRIANELAAEGFIRFAPNPHHQRAKLVELTAKGRSAYAAATGRWRPQAVALAAAHRRKDLDSALMLLRELRQRIAAIRRKGKSDHADQEQR